MDDVIQYDQRRDLLRHFYSNENGKYTFVQNGMRGVIQHELLDRYLLEVSQFKGDSDFHMLFLIRFLYTAEDNELSGGSIQDAKIRIVNTLETFPFWPKDCTNRNIQLDDIVFWSENHLLMTLSSCFLLRQYINNPIAQLPSPYLRSSDNEGEGEDMVNEDIKDMEGADLETRLLQTYLNAHCLPEFNGMYEAGSTVYLPFSICALLNIRDFSHINSLRQRAIRLLHIISHHIALLTPSKLGICNIAASARSFPRTRLRNFGHNINTFLYLLAGVCADSVTSFDVKPIGPTQLADFLLTTGWKPAMSVFATLQNDCCERGLQMSHPVRDTRDVYRRAAEPLFKDWTLSDWTNEMVPFYWSAGLITHPLFINETRRYQQQKGLQHNTHLWPLRWLGPHTLTYLMQTSPLLSEGQAYTGLLLTVFKRSQQGLLLSSFQRFSPQRVAFQQQTWMACVDGAPIWSQAGGGERCERGLLGFGVTSSHNPTIQQRGSILLACYHPKKGSLGPRLFGEGVRLFWPLSLFTRTFLQRARVIEIDGIRIVEGLMEEERLPIESEKQEAFCWWAGQRGQCYIAVLCSQRSQLNGYPCKDATLQLRQMKDGQWQEIHENIPRLENLIEEEESKKKRLQVVSWLVVVGAQSNQWPSLEAFLQRRCSVIIITEQQEEEKKRWMDWNSRRCRNDYRITISDPWDETMEQHGPIVFETNDQDDIQET